MTPERWQKLEEIFQTAIALPSQDRRAFLSRACEGDDALRREAESLIAHADGSDLGAPVRDVAGRIAAEQAGRYLGRRIGPYRVTSVIGSGGMGVVYAAVRDDQQYSKQVAIKLVKRGMDTDFVLGRFRTERQILATLEHPQIARLIDGGATEDGQPYLVMEHVDGLPITQYCENNRLSLVERLDLFRSVCEAVQYAHRNLVVHRDIKPGNILVTKERLPKLLDFGVAKLLAPAPPSEQGTLTSLGVQMLTPDYASPEQVRGERVTTATDVYSLGAVLYELLTGVRPHRLNDYTPEEIEEAICRAEVERPSMAVLRNERLPEKIRRQAARGLTGDLDNIVLMALRKEAERRYASVEQLSEDLRQYFRGRPVSARPDTLAYRAGKFVRRYKLAVAAGVVAAASLVAGSAATFWQARRAEQRFQQVRKLANVFLFDLHDRLQNLAGATEVRQFVVRTGLEYLASLEREAGGDRALMRELALAYQKVGDVQGYPLASNLGDRSGAMDSYQKTIRILEGIDPRSRDSRVQLDRAEAYRKLAEVQIARGDLRAALATFRKAQSIVQAVLESDAANQPAMTLLGILQNSVGRALSTTFDIPALAREAAEAVAFNEKLAAANPSDPRLLGVLATSYRLTGTALQRAGRHQDALGYFLKNVDIRERRAAMEPSNVGLRRQLMLAHSFVGDLLIDPMMTPPEPSRALDSFRKMLAIAEAFAKQDAADRRLQIDVANSLQRVGAALALTARHEEALDYLRTALKMTEALSAAAPDNFVLGFNAVFLHERVAYVLAAQGNVRPALVHSRTALASIEKLMAKDPELSVRYVLRAYTTYLPLLGRARDRTALAVASARLPALVELTKSKKIHDRQAVAGGPLALAAAGEAHSLLGDPKQACLWRRKSLDRWKELRGAGFTGGQFDSEPPMVEAHLAACALAR
jgi:serine/threonine protein kinase